MAEADYAPWEVTELIDAYELRIDEAEAERDAALARLTTAETESDTVKAMLFARDEQLRAAEARVEAAEQAIKAALCELERISDVRSSAFKIIGNADLILRAALACPPQQRGE